jgi:hypothetical protein
LAQTIIAQAFKVVTFFGTTAHPVLLVARKK